jgi:hypothetical protein
MERHPVNSPSSASRQRLPASPQTDSLQSAENDTEIADYDVQRIMRAAAPGQMTPRHVMQLQRTIGNAATRRLIAPSQSAPTVQRLTLDDIRKLPPAKKKIYDDAVKKGQQNGLSDNAINKMSTDAKFLNAFVHAIDAAIQEAQMRQAAKAQAQPMPLLSNENLVAYEKEKPAAAEPKPSKQKAEKPEPEQDSAANDILTALYGNSQPAAQQNVPEPTPRQNIYASYEQIKDIKTKHLGQVTQFIQSNMTEDTISFEVVVDVQAVGVINAYHFVIHYHPAGGVNDLHAKENHASVSNIELSRKNWLVNNDPGASIFKASCEAWKNTHGKK